MAHAYLNGPSTPRTWKCTKVGFNTRKEAVRTLVSLRNHDHNLTDHGKGKLQVYKCKSCPLFHHGNR